MLENKYFGKDWDSILFYIKNKKLGIETGANTNSIYNIHTVRQMYEFIGQYLEENEECCVMMPVNNGYLEGISIYEGTLENCFIYDGENGYYISVNKATRYKWVANGWVEVY